MRTAVDRFHFNGAMIVPDAANVTAGPWGKTVGLGATALNTAEGLALALSASSQAENVRVNFADVLSYPIDDLIRFDAWVKVSDSLDASVQVALGMAGAGNDAIDAIAQAALFRLVGSNDLVVETDDGAHDNDDVATGLTLGDSFRRLGIDFKTGVQTVSPGPSKGGKASVLFTAENGQGLLRPLLKDTLFDMSAYAGGLQPYFQILKTAGAATGTLTIQRVEIEYRY